MDMGAEGVGRDRAPLGAALKWWVSSPHASSSPWVSLPATPVESHSRENGADRSVPLTLWVCPHPGKDEEKKARELHAASGEAPSIQKWVQHQEERAAGATAAHFFLLLFCLGSSSSAGGISSQWGLHCGFGVVLARYSHSGGCGGRLAQGCE